MVEESTLHKWVNSFEYVQTVRMADFCLDHHMCSYSACEEILSNCMVAYRTSDLEVPGLNPARGRIRLMTVLHFTA